MSEEKPPAIEAEITLLSTKLKLITEVPTKIAPRAFLLSSGITVLALLLQETVDSFYLLLPAEVKIDRSSARVVEYVPTTVVRLLKTSGIVSEYLPSGLALYAYIRYLQANCGKIPDYFNEERTSNLQAIRAALEDGNPELSKTTGGPTSSPDGKAAKAMSEISRDQPKDEGTSVDDSAWSEGPYNPDPVPARLRVKKKSVH